MKKYKTIVADPPWDGYGNWRSGSDKALVKKLQGVHIPMPYKTMTLEQIKAIPVKNITDDNCEIYLWVTQRHLPNGFEVLKAWGFKYCQTLTWCKKPMGTGQGGIYCPTTEFILLGRKGKMPIKIRQNTTWFEVKRQKSHSKKPDFFQDLIETVTDAPRLEMFARRERSGWDVFGNEVESTIVL